MTQDLIQGAAEFKRYHYESDSDLMGTLVKMGQDPKYFIISCIDSRCNPGTIFRAQPGIFFAHKAMGAIVRPYHQGTALAAALQFAINYNKIETIIVLGHTKCGAIKALVENLDDPEITSFIHVAKHAHNIAEAACITPDEIICRTEEEVILESTENLKHYPSVAHALAAKKISVKSWQFDIENGNLREYDENAKEFKILTTEPLKEDSRVENA